MVAPNCLTHSIREYCSYSKARTYSTANPGSLDPEWVTGFTDAEGSFVVSLTKRENGQDRVKVSFEILLHLKDIVTLYKIQSFLGCGVISKLAENSSYPKCSFKVNAIDDLVRIVIPHFRMHALHTQKYADFVLWSQVVMMVKSQEHQTAEGLLKIQPIYASINRGISSKAKERWDFSNIIPVPRPMTPIYDLNPYWVSGFTAGDGSFVLSTRSSGQVDYSFSLTQHSRDTALFHQIQTFFGHGTVTVRSKGDRVDFAIQDISSLQGIVSTHFISHPLNSIKQLDFEDWYKGLLLIKAKSHKTSEGLFKIQAIISGMNSRRK